MRSRKTRARSVAQLWASPHTGTIASPPGPLRPHFHAPPGRGICGLALARPESAAARAHPGRQSVLSILSILSDREFGPTSHGLNEEES